MSRLTATWRWPRNGLRAVRGSRAIRGRRAIAAQRRLQLHALVGLIALYLGVAGCLGEARAQRAPGDTPPAVTVQPRHQPQGQAEAASRLACERETGRVFIAHADGRECIAYHLTPEPAGQREAVFYFHGDLTAREVQAPEFTAGYLARMRRALAAIAARENVPIVFVSRPGVLGSSGNHGARWQPREMLSMNAAVDAIKSRHAISTIVVAGQSGGSTIAAALLTLGRRDITCAVLGSGALLLAETVSHLRTSSGVSPSPLSLLRKVYFDPAEHIAGIAAQPGRRLFVLGDPRDLRTPFELQRRFASRMTASGHHAVAVEVPARGTAMHNVAHLTLPAAARCARGLSDQEILRGLAPSPAPNGSDGTGLSDHDLADPQ